MSEEQIKAILGDLWQSDYVYHNRWRSELSPAIQIDSRELVYVCRQIHPASERRQFLEGYQNGDWCVFVDDEIYGKMLTSDARQMASWFNRAADICDRLNQWQRDNT